MYSVQCPYHQYSNTQAFGSHPMNHQIFESRNIRHIVPLLIAMRRYPFFMTGFKHRPKCGILSSEYYAWTTNQAIAELFYDKNSEWQGTDDKFFL